MVYPDQRNSGSVGVGVTEKGSWGIAVRKILERARETSPAGRCHHGVAACIDLGGPSGLRCGAGADGLAELRHLALRVVQRQFVRGVEGVGFVLRH